MGMGDTFPGVKRPRRDANHSLPSRAEVKICGAIPPLPPYVFMAWYLIKQGIRLHDVVFSFKHRKRFTVLGF
jgi:hypothetical protein